ncbi:MAG: sigma-70 family RNA polymerase sigma factor [Burkholderiaceae bacterium]
MIALLPRLRRYAWLLTGNDAAADDLVQETLVRGWSKRTAFRPDGDLRVWLLAIMHNLFVSQWRASREEREASAARDGRADDHRSADPSFGGDAASAAQGIERWIDLQRGLARLSPEHRQILLLVCVEDMSYAEVGLLLGVPIGTVMSRLSRARAQLRQWCGDVPPSRPALRVVGRRSGDSG